MACMDPYHIRLAEARDVERVLGIISRHDEDDEEEAREFFRNYCEQPDDTPESGRYFVLEVEDDLVGVGGYIPSGGTGEYWIGYLYIDPYYQGQGLGTWLLNTICDTIKAIGAERVFVEVDVNDIPSQALRFYEVNGFKSDGKKGHPDRSSLIYSKEI